MCLKMQIDVSGVDPDKTAHYPGLHRLTRIVCSSIKKLMVVFVRCVMGNLNV